MNQLQLYLCLGGEHCGHCESNKKPLIRNQYFDIDNQGVLTEEKAELSPVL